jgi:hypothetical protein
MTLYDSFSLPSPHKEPSYSPELPLKEESLDDTSSDCSLVDDDSFALFLAGG